MLFLSDSSIGIVVVDTKDWSKEIVTKTLLNKYSKAGLMIADNMFQESVLEIIQSLYNIQSEIGGGSTFDMCEEYIRGNIDASGIAYDIDNFSMSLLNDIKEKYNELKNRYNLKDEECIYKRMYETFVDIARSTERRSISRDEAIGLFCNIYSFDKRIVARKIWVFKK